MVFETKVKRRSGPGNNDSVVEGDEIGGEYRGDSDTGESLVDGSENRNITSLELLTEAKLHEKKRDTHKE